MRPVLNAKDIKKYAHLSEEQLIDEIKVMDTKRKEAENNFQYRDAENIRQHIEEMKMALEKKKMFAIHENHNAERLNVEGEKQKKITQLEEFWEGKLKEFNEKREIHLQRLKEKHREDFTAYESMIQEQIPLKTKKSAAILNSEKIMKGLANKQKYKEAELLYEKIKHRVAQEEEEYQMEREKKIANLLNKKLNQQLNEEKAIILKHEASLNEILANKDNEFRKLNNKICSFSRTLENLQINEYNNFERDVRGENQQTSILKGTEYGQLIKDNTKVSRVCILK